MRLTVGGPVGEVTHLSRIVTVDETVLKLLAKLQHGAVDEFFVSKNILD